MRALKREGVNPDRIVVATVEKENNTEAKDGEEEQEEEEVPFASSRDERVVRSVRARSARIFIISLSHILITSLHLMYTHLMYTQTPTLECTLEMLRKTNSRFALEHRYVMR